MLTVLLGAVTNIVLDPIFIFAFHMGVQGAALGHCHFPGSFRPLGTPVSHWETDHLPAGPGGACAFVSPLIREITGLGMSGFCHGGHQQRRASGVQRHPFLSMAGDVYVGDHDRHQFRPGNPPSRSMAFTNGAQPVMALITERGEYGRVRQGIQFTSIACILYTTVAWVCMMLIPAQFIHLFNSDPELISWVFPP